MLIGVEIGAIVEGSTEFYQQTTLLQAICFISPLFSLPRNLVLTGAKVCCGHPLCFVAAQSRLKQKQSGDFSCYIQSCSKEMWHIFNLTKCTSVRQYIEIFFINFFQYLCFSNPVPPSHSHIQEASSLICVPVDLLAKLPQLIKKQPGSGSVAEHYQDFSSSRALELCSLVTITFYVCRSLLHRCGTSTIALFASEHTGKSLLCDLNRVLAAFALLSTSSTGFLRGIAQSFFFDLYADVVKVFSSALVSSSSSSAPSAAASLVQASSSSSASVPSASAAASLSLVQTDYFSKYCAESNTLLFNFLKNSEEFMQV
jgi:hypothetical protein